MKEAELLFFSERNPLIANSLIFFQHSSTSFTFSSSGSFVKAVEVIAMLKTDSILDKFLVFQHTKIHITKFFFCSNIRTKN